MRPFPMLRTSFLFILFVLPCVLMSQPFWVEDFDTDPGNCASQGQLAGGFDSGNGVWTLTETGANGQFANVWYVSATEAGMGEGNCGDGCGIDPSLTNNTLHVGSDLFGDGGAAYLETGGGITNTNVRAESPVIDCSAQTDISLSLLYLSAGNNPTDACFLEYFDGAVWTELSILASTPFGPCAPQGQWTLFNIDLPASADNNPGVRIGFRWENLDDGVATDPSVAIDDVELTGEAAAGEIFASFTVSNDEICVDDCIDFEDTSVGVGIDTWEWTFEGADPPSSTDQNPEQICYSVPGIYAVTLAIESPDANDELTEVGYITVTACGNPPEVDFSSSIQNICAGDCVDFDDLTTGEDLDEWSWVFNGADTPDSDVQNPADICYSVPGSYSVTLTVTNAFGSDELTIEDFIVVENCDIPPVVDFTANILEVCEGDCIDFSDLTEGTDLENWEWTFDGADTPGSFDQNPEDICYATAGSYDVTLSVSNAFGSDELTLADFITVIECDGPLAGFTAVETTICVGDCVDFINQSIGGANIFNWTFDGAETSDSADENPAGICYLSEGQYDVTLEVSNGVDTDIITLPNFITVESCSDLPDIEISASATVICLGDCVSFQDETDSDDISGWEWSFAGGTPGTSVDQNPAQVCYQNEGSFNVTLEATIEGETVQSTFSNFITVVDTCGPIANFDYTPIVCLGQCYSFTNTSTGGSEYFWTFEGALPQTSEDFSPQEICYLDQTGVFNVTLTVVNEFGSSTSITQQVSVVNPPLVNAGPDQTIVQGTSAALTATGGNNTGTFLWQPFEDVTCFNCSATTTYPLNETTTFVVYYEQSGGCQNSDTVTVFVEESFSIGVPGSFSPNGDGVNDILFVRGSNITQLEFVIYNRYGQKVFETTSQKNGWDGTMNGRELNAGVFGYYLQVSLTDGTQNVLKGDITLVR